MRFERIFVDDEGRKLCDFLGASWIEQLRRPGTEVHERFGIFTFPRLFHWAVHVKNFLKNGNYIQMVQKLNMYYARNSHTFTLYTILLSGVYLKLVRFSLPKVDGWRY